MTFLKHGGGHGGPKKRKKAADKPEAEPLRVVLDTDPAHIVDPIESVARFGLDEIALALGKLSDALNAETAQTYQGETKLAVFTGPSGSGFHPVLIALEPSDTMDRIIAASERIATAFERIADSMTGKPMSAEGDGPKNLEV